MKWNCFSCQKELSFDKISLREECPHCGADVHVCKNCRFYDEKAYNECKEPQAERVRERDRANRCDYFEAGRGDKTDLSKKDQLKAAAEALFKKS